MAKKYRRKRRNLDKSFAGSFGNRLKWIGLMTISGFVVLCLFIFEQVGGGIFASALSVVGITAYGANVFLVVLTNRYAMFRNTNNEHLISHTHVFGLATNCFCVFALSIPFVLLALPRIGFLIASAVVVFLGTCHVVFDPLDTKKSSQMINT